VKTLPLVVFFFLTAGLLPAARAGEVWIAIRTDGHPGKGTRADPYDGSTSARMKDLFSSIPPEATLHFAEGVYPVEPCSRYDGGGPLASGVELKSGWKLVGAGQGRTVLQADYTGLSTHGGHTGQFILLQGGLARPEGLVGCEIRSLTLDNRPGSGGAYLPAPTAIATALGLNGTHCLVDNVEMIHGYGGFSAPGNTATGEAFYVTIARPPGADGEGNTVRRCRLHAVSDGKSLELLTAISGCGETSYDNRGVLFEANTIDGLDERGQDSTQGINWFSGSGHSALVDFRIVGNTVSHCGNLVYNDTTSAPTRGLRVVGNVFRLVSGGTGVYVLGRLTDALIAGNLFSSDDGQGINIGQDHPAVAGLVIRDNTFYGHRVCAINLNDNPNLSQALVTRNAVHGTDRDGSIVNATGLGERVAISENSTDAPDPAKK